MTQATAIQTSNTERWQNKDGAHHLHPFTNPNDLLQKPARIIESAQGVYLTDSDGNELLDMMAGLWCVNMGYGQQALIDAAASQIQQLPYYNALFKTSTPPAAELSELLSEVTPAHMNHAFCKRVSNCRTFMITGLIKPIDNCKIAYCCMVWYG